MTNRIVKALEDGAQRLGKTLGEDAGKAVKNLYHDTGDRLRQVAKNHAETDAKHASEMEGILKGRHGDMPKDPHVSPSSSPHTSGGPGGEGPKGPKDPVKGPGSGRPNSSDPSLRDGANRDGVGSSKPGGGRCKGGDPIDLVSGEMILTATDVRLPGLLDLVVERTHLSSYRCGQWFGSSWASTLDQRLEADERGLVLATADGMLLSYDVPAPNTVNLPHHGPRRELRWDGTPAGEILVTDPDTGHTLHFMPATVTPAEAAAGRVTLPLQALTDRNGHRVDIWRDDDGTPFEIRHSGGYRIAVDTDGDRVVALRLLGTEDGEAGTVLRRYGYDDGQLTAVTDALGHTERFHYDESGRIVERVDRNGGWYRWEYDGADRCVRGTGSDGYLSCTLTYDVRNRANSYTNSLGRTTVYHYDEQRRLTGWTDAEGHRTHRTWAGRDLLASVTDELGHTSSYTYDDGNLTTVTRPDGRTTRATYNALGLPVEIVEVDGATWRHEYDARGNQVRTTDPTGAVTSFAYDHGRLSAVTDALGHTRTVASDPAGLPLAVTDPLGHTTVVERDAFGRVSSYTDACGRTERFGWTAEGKPAWREFADGATEIWEWDGEGNLVAHTDRLGQVSRFTYTHFGIPVTRTAPDGTTYTFAHDTELRLTTVTDPRGHTWDYAYDAVGHLVRESDFQGRAVEYRPDPTGNLAARTTAAGRTTVFVRDELGRTVEEHSPDGIATFAYDPAGCLLRSANATTTVAHTYDVLGRKLSEDINGRTTTWTYDALGRRTGRRTPSGVLSTWSYDAAGRPATLDVGGDRVGFAFDDADREVRRLIGPDLVLSQEWDSAGRLSSQAVTRGADTLQHRAYAYRADGHLRGITDSAGGTRHFELDPDGRVTAVRAQDWTETYAYDSAGNLTHAEVPGDQTAGTERTFTGNRLERCGRHSYAYDEDGRMVRRTTRLLNGQTRTASFAWNTADQLTDAVLADGTHWTYEYDTAGRRTVKRQLDGDGRPAQEVRFVWDGTRLAEQVTSDGTATVWDYHSGTHRPLTQTVVRTEGRVDFHTVVTDVSGAPTELVTPDGRITWRLRTTAWGTPVGDGPADTCPLRFPGQYADAETGWNYNYFRHYDPETARYLTPDPLGLVAAPNHYAYVDNPLTVADPLGLTPQRGPNGRFIPNPNGPATHNRDTEYPGSYRQSTHDAMTSQWTVEGQAQGGVPRFPAGHPEAGQRIPRDQLNWFNSKGEPVPAGKDELTYEHLHPVVDHWNKTGYNSDRATRNDFYNDANNMEPMSRKNNSSGGGKMTSTYRQDTGPNYSCT
ncbi:DUF6531 domain-containing protein [Streptomyces sp. 769]|uniref:DUF6531 domain-containing protein n=1 Tax=Streptomyces sp. 769 TaxID=1262452 RepID=UPI000581CC15|nr:DUF6531 domain-containing protein [Streptomyces sp. 769]AJC60510.1 LipX3 [Streptomyces sp. 769]